MADAGEVPNGKIVLVLGAPGSGKGTLCKRLVDDAAFHARHGLAVSHRSVGDLLRGLMARPGGLGPAQRRKVEKQELMGGKELAQVLAGEVRRARSARQPSTAVAGGGGQQVQVLLLDGVPRNMEQLEAFDSEFGNVDLVLSLQCPRDVALQRYLGRHDPTRPDGDAQLFSTRFAEFAGENPRIVQVFKQTMMPHSVIEVDVGSTTAGVDENYAKLKTLLQGTRGSPWFETAE